MSAPDLSAEERAIVERFDAAEAAPESYHLQPVTLRLMDALGITPYIERLAAWLSRHLPQSRSTR